MLCPSAILGRSSTVGPWWSGTTLGEDGLVSTSSMPSANGPSIINDAAMQALASYRGKRMPLLGLGTGLGSALIVDGVLEPMELAHLP